LIGREPTSDQTRALLFTMPEVSPVPFTPGVWAMRRAGSGGAHNRLTEQVRRINGKDGPTILAKVIEQAKAGGGQAQAAA
jgi:hypothetical protein